MSLATRHGRNLAAMIPTEAQLRAHIERWDITQVYTVFGEGSEHQLGNRTESLVHELSHLATLGVALPTESTVRNISWLVTTAIDEKCRMRRQPKYISLCRKDTNEIETVGLEIEVMRAIGRVMPLDRFLADAVSNVVSYEATRQYRVRVNLFRDSARCDRLINPLVKYLCGPPAAYITKEESS